MDDLALWLTAQLDEDDAEARRGYLKAEPLPDFDGWDNSTTAGLPPAVAARVLREIEAKRQILARYVDAAKAVAELTAVRERLHAGGKDLLMTEMDLESAVHRRDTLHGVLRLLALPFEDRPGFQESWRP